jgi:hypothetical protein
MRERHKLRRLEDGPAGGTPILQGAELMGHALDAPIEQGWQLGRVRDFSLAQTAFQLLSGKLWLPTMKRAETQEIPIAPIERVAQIGPYHADINGRTQNGGIRGPFDVMKLRGGTVPTYPVLWSHEANRERVISFEAESECVPRVGRNEDEQELIDQKIESIWASASYCHFNRDFRFNSQSTAMQFTQHKTIGGRAWLSISLPTRQQEMALTLWANCTLGILMYWWIANKQQAGRGSIGKTALQRLPVLDVTRLLESEALQVRDAFKRLSKSPLKPIHKMDADPVRRELDAMLLPILGFSADLDAPNGPMELLRLKLAREPSILGQKKT